jgi:aldehyde dehydrogenase (NAD+)
VLNIVPGGPEAGEYLVRHPAVGKISFTGGPATAHRIQAACAESLTPLVLELGGKSANIVFADADLDSAVAAAARGVSSMSGQVCVAPTRLLVERSVYAQVVERVAGTLTQVKIGDPFDPDSEMGPVISAAALDRILSMVDKARESVLLRASMAAGSLLP